MDAIWNENSLKGRVLRGGAWLGAGSFLEQLTRLVRNMVLARVLAPEAFGTMAVVLSVGSLIETTLEVGIRESFIQNPRSGEREYINIAWWLCLSRAVVIYALAFAASPWIAEFYKNPALAPLLRVTLVGTLFNGAISMRAIHEMKEIKFGKWAIIWHGGGILGVALTVMLCVMMKNIWALAVGFCAESAARLLLSYAISPFRPAFKFAADAARDLLKFSKGMYGLTFLNLVFYRADIFILARLCAPAHVGLYAMAVQLVRAPMSFVIGVLNQIMMPVFSEIQSDTVRINRILLRTTFALLILGIPVVIWVSFCGQSILHIAYGEPYRSAYVPLALATFAALLNILNGQITTVFFARGLPQMHRGCVFVMAVSTVGLAYPLVQRFGLAGGAAAGLAAVAIGYSFQLAAIRKLMGLNLAQYGKGILIAGAFSLVVAIVCFGTGCLEDKTPPLFTLAVGFAGCLASYGLAFSVLGRRFQTLT